MVRDVSGVYYSAWSFSRSYSSLVAHILTTFIHVSLGIDGLIDLLLHELLLLLNVHLYVCLLLITFLDELLLAELLARLNVLSLATHLILLLNHLLILLALSTGLASLWHDRLHYKSSFSFIR